MIQCTYIIYCFYEKEVYKNHIEEGVIWDD